MARRSDIEGFGELEATFRELGRVPQSAATRSARAGAGIALRAARRNAPVDTGALKSGIIVRGEKTRVRGKKVYDVMLDPAKTDLYRRSTKTGYRRKGGRGRDANTKIRGGYFYPASQEFGFFTVDGRYIPGFGYLRRAIDENHEAIERKILEVTRREVDKALRKRR